MPALSDLTIIPNIRPVYRETKPEEWEELSELEPYKEEVAQFRRNGWDFERVPASESAASPRVCAYGDHLLLDTGAIIIAFERKVEEDEARRILTNHQCRNVQSQACNSYRALVDDAFGVSEALEELEGVIFAEPDFLEIIGGR